MNASRRLLRDLAAHDEQCAQGVLSFAPEMSSGLDRRTFALVQLSALLALDAATDSVRWAVDRAATNGIGDSMLAEVLVSIAPAAGAARAVASAARLALALDVDVEVDGWDGT